MAVALENVTFGYDGTMPVLRDFSLTFPQTGVVWLSGASGCGKTTILRLLAGLERPQAGTITGLDGKTLAMVFQENRLLPWRSVADNVAMGAAQADRAAVLACLRVVGLEAAAAQYPAMLSGGMQRRVAIARALMADADILLLDEPFTGVDAPTWQAIARYIRTAYAERLVVLVTHVSEEAEVFDAKPVNWHTEVSQENKKG